MTQSNSHRVVSEEKGESDTNITHQDDWHGKLSKQVKDLMKKYSEVQKTWKSYARASQHHLDQLPTQRTLTHRRLLHFPGKDNWRSLAEKEQNMNKPLRASLRIWKQRKSYPSPKITVRTLITFFMKKGYWLRTGLQEQSVKVSNNIENLVLKCKEILFWLPSLLSEFSLYIKQQCDCNCKILEVASYWNLNNYGVARCTISELHLIDSNWFNDRSSP